MKRLALVALLGACGSSLEAAPMDPAPAKSLVPVSGELCVTRGAAKLGGSVDQPTVRAVAPGTSGDAAALEFVVRGDTTKVKALADGEARRQLGLKLRAQDGCNLVYVMWRLDPKPKIEVSVKRNPGAKTHEACGADGYTKVKPARSSPAPALAEGDRHVLRADITGRMLTAWIDDRMVWRGTLPITAAGLEGPAGLRSDNLAFDLVGFRAAAGAAGEAPRCHRDESD